MRSESTLFVDEKCTRCGHMEDRHFMRENGNGRTRGKYVCLTGFYCICGHKKPRKKPAPKKSTSGMAYRGVKPEDRKPVLKGES